MRKAIRDHLRDFLAIITLAVIAIFTLLVIFYNQKAAFPSWFPVLGQDFYELNAEFSSAQAVTPGQGQAIQIAGIQVGKVGRSTSMFFGLPTSNSSYCSRIVGISSEINLALLKADSQINSALSTF